MRKLLKILAFRNVLLKYPSQNYCIYRYMRSNFVPESSFSGSHKVIPNLNTLPSPQASKENCKYPLYVLL